MELDDLIKKLENTDIPEIEIKSHKAGLRLSLLESDYFKKADFFEVFKRYFYFAVPVFAVLMILGITVIQPKLTEAKVLGIAKDNPEIQKLIGENNMTLSQVKIIDGKAYILLNLPADIKKAIVENPGIIINKKSINNMREDTEGAIIEVDLGKKEVNKISSISSDEINPLDDEEKNSAEDIASSEEIIGNIIPKEATIEKIQSYLSREIRLEKEDGGVKVVSQLDNSDDDKKARVQYNLDGKKWVVRVNLDAKRVEEIQYSSDN